MKIVFSVRIGVIVDFALLKIYIQNFLKNVMISVKDVMNMDEKRFRTERDSTKAFTLFYDGRRRMYDEEVVNLLNEQTVEIQKLTKERNQYKGQIKQKNDKIERLQRENNKLQVHYKYDVKHLKEENERLKSRNSYNVEDMQMEIGELKKENERLRKENTALDNENAEYLADYIKELDLLEKLTKFLHECDLTDEQRALFHDMITEEDLQPNLEVVMMNEKRFDFPVRNVTDIIIKDLQGNYYDINMMLYCKGNDEIIIKIKKPNEEYKDKNGDVV